MNYVLDFASILCYNISTSRFKKGIRMKQTKRKPRIQTRNTFRTISIGFMLLILCGALLLMLPISSQSRGE